MKRRHFLLHASACGCAICAPFASAQGTSADDNPEFCTTIPPDDVKISRAYADNIWSGNSPGGSSGAEAGARRSTRWNPDKRELRVATRTSGTLFDRVFSAASEWHDHMPLRFKLVALNDSPEVIIDFLPGKGHWSYVGTDSGYNARRGRQTMNFGWDKSPDATRLKRVALHEFGHAMGLIHEQASPAAQIDWDKPAVYREYQRTQGWDSAQTEANVIRRYTEAEVNRTAYDPKSIMHYPVPRELVLDQSDVVGWNNKLSDADKAMAAWLWS